MEILKQWGNLLTPDAGFQVADLWQLAVIVLIMVMNATLFRPKGIVKDSDLYTLHLWFRKNLGFICFTLAILVIYLPLALFIERAFPIFRFFAILSSFWLLIGLASSFLREKFWADSVACFAYLISGMFGLALVDDGMELLNSLSLQIGSFHVTASDILAGVLAFALTLWISMALARIIEGQVKTIPKLTPSLRVLITKIIRIIFIFLACIIAISSMGVDLSALTVLGGAVGLGLGFGLQKVVSNFVSGIILLLDNSIKPGDVIEVEGSYGWVNNLRARYASIITRDGTEHLIPNENLITQKVTNWSFTDNLVRTKVPVGVAYGSDPHQCIDLILQAAKDVPRILKDPAPVCHLKGFGDSSVDLELRFWIADPANGVSNVQSQVLLNIWDIFKEHEIEIPFPQRDLHIRSSEIIPVQRSHPDPE